MPTITRFVDPSAAAAGGTGLGLATAYKYPTEVPDLTGIVIGLRGDGLIHRPQTIPTAPTDVSAAVFLIKQTGTGLVSVDTYTGGNVTSGLGGNPIISGAVEIASGSIGSTTVNSLTCKTYDRGSAVSPFWYPISKGRETYPSICAPGVDDSTDNFIADPSAYDQIVEGQSGFRFVPAANYGGSTDATKEFSYVDTTIPGPARYVSQIRAPGWLARIAAAGVSIVGAKMVMRTGANFTDYFCDVLTYNAGLGFITVGSSNRPDDTAGTAGQLFFALVAHQYGLRKPRQYAMLASGSGWVFHVPGASNVGIEMACYSTAFQFISTVSPITFNTAKTWTFQHFVHANSATRGGSALVLEQGAGGLTIGPMILKGMRAFSRDGAACKVAGTGAATTVTLSTVTINSCMGVRVNDLSSSGISTGLTVGAIRVNEGSNFLRIAGRLSGFSCSGGSKAPCDAVHDNGALFYQDARDCSMLKSCHVTRTILPNNGSR